MIHVRLPTGIEDWDPVDRVVAVHEGQIDPTTPVSFDRGSTWTSASAAAMRIGQKRVGNELTRAFVPRGWEPLAAFAWWFGWSWSFFIAAPTCLLAAGYASQSTSLVMLGAFIIGPFPLVVIGRRAHVAVNRSRHRGLRAELLCYAMSVVITAGMVWFRFS